MIREAITLEQWKERVLELYPQAEFRNAEQDPELEDDPMAFSASALPGQNHPDYTIARFQPALNFANVFHDDEFGTNEEFTVSTAKDSK